MKGFEDYLTIAQLAKCLPGKWSERYIRYLIDTKQIPYFSIGHGKKLFRLDDIEKWLESKRQVPEDWAGEMKG